MTTATRPPATLRTRQFHGQPLPRLVELRDRYLALYSSDPMTAHYSAAALAELDAAIAAAWAGGAA